MQESGKRQNMKFKKMIHQNKKKTKKQRNRKSHKSKNPEIQKSKIPKIQKFKYLSKNRENETKIEKAKT